MASSLKTGGTEEDYRATGGNARVDEREMAGGGPAPANGRREKA
jgi:hypothetical protein